MKGETNEQFVRHLFEAIDRVREDVAKVEFWASAVSGFAEPVPGYEPDSTRVWFRPSRPQASSAASPTLNDVARVDGNPLDPHGHQDVERAFRILVLNQGRGPWIGELEHGGLALDLSGNVE
jgi:hypothetical protein